MPEPHTHYFEVDMQLTNLSALPNYKKTGYIDVKMPVWTPGSYLIREYAKNVEGFTAKSGSTKNLVVDKIRKNTWRVFTTDEAVTVHYKVYANELSVRNSFIDSDHGYLNGASMFMYLDALKNQPLQLIVQPYPAWKSVATGLRRTSPSAFTYEAPDYDRLVDSPIEIGNHATINFTASGIPHTIAMFGEVTYDKDRLAADYKRVCETAATVVGEHPCTDYTFLVHHIPNAGGGLEHLNSTTLQTGRNVYQSEAAYRGFLTLVAHEYFHLWNVKRIRPIALGPFDYETENYTHLLWLSEGITSFYEDYILRRAGITTPDQYLNGVANDINGIENQPGTRVQSAAESSWDAWIKGYRPNENSANSTISYYSKGSVLGTLLNLTILSGSNGARNLDDLMRYLYTEYYKKQKRGFTDDEFKRAVAQVAGQNVDAFFNKYVFGTDIPDYNAFFEPVGIKLTNVASPVQDGFLGASVSPAGGKLTVQGVRRGSAAWTDGLNVGDEILSVDSLRATDDLNRLLAGRRTGETINVLINRNGLVRNLPVRLTENPLRNYRFEPVANPTPKQRELYAKWLYVR
ncbi:MAG: M61 family metallopeptidase [Bacteroidetes bacterium]|nr:M61 family metallopeptidase [Fibrella sp.]